MTASPIPAFTLDKQGITTGAELHWNLGTAPLIEKAVARGEGLLSEHGAFVVKTGKHTGRSAKDKFTVEDATTRDTIWFNGGNQRMAPEHFAALKADFLAALAEKKTLFVQDLYGGSQPEYRVRVRIINELAWHNLFVRTLLVRPNPVDLPGFLPEFTIIDLPSFRADPARHGCRTETVIAVNFTEKLILIGGTAYAGEMKKSVFGLLNYMLPEQGVMPMHCSANIGSDGSSAVFFGLSGTGKTTLSADPDRALIGDDEHGWSKRGVFNFEGGCYAKCIRLSQEGEPQIWNAIRFGSVLENVVLNDRREPDYDDGSITENTRVTYPVQFIPNAKIPSVAGHPKNVIFLTADAFGVLPPVSRLTREQAMYYFVNGYTSKLAGTEAGVTEPQPNFSPCFGGPFLPRPPRVYADMLAERIDEHDSDVWLLNTGWSGGPYGIGRRFNLAFTRAMVSAILDGSLAAARFAPDPVFGLLIPHEVAGVPNDMLHPRQMWGDKAAYDLKAKELAARFRENDAKYDLPAEVRAAGPRG